MNKNRQVRYHYQIRQASTGKTNVSCSSSENGIVACVCGWGDDDRHVKIMSDSEKIDIQSVNVTKGNVCIPCE